MQIKIIANNFKEGVDSNTDSPIRMDGTKPAEPLRETEKKKEPEEEIDIPPWMRNNKR